MVDMGIDGQIEKNYDQNLNGFDIKDVKECMYNEGVMQGYLFRCLHCGEHFYMLIVTDKIEIMSMQ